MGLGQGERVHLSSFKVRARSEGEGPFELQPLRVRVRADGSLHLVGEVRASHLEHPALVGEGQSWG